MSKKITFEEFEEILKGKAQRVITDGEQAVADCMMKIQRECVKGMENTRHSSKGVYTHNKSELHYPSLPGEYPAVDSGNMVKKVTFEVETKGDSVIGRVGSTITDPDYPRKLEYGQSNVRARPWLKPSIVKASSYIKQRLGVK